MSDQTLSTNQTCFKRIKLNNEITTKNFIGCLIHYFMLSFIFVSVDSLQPMLLQKKFNIEEKDISSSHQNALVIVFDIIVKLITAPFFGYLADRKGRSMINLYGILWIGATMMLMPYSQELYQYVILRCFYAQGAIAISVVPLLADYVNHYSRGTCAAFLVFMSSLGAVSSAFINFTILSQVQSDIRINLQYGVISILILVIGVVYTVFFLKKGNKYYLTGNNEKKTFKQLLSVARYSLKHPQLSTGYIAAFLARSDSILLSLYLVLWTYSFKEYDYHTSSQKASALSGITYSIIMITCIIYGFFYEKKNMNKRNLMIGMLSFALFGAVSMNFATEIENFMTYFSLSILGIGMSGLLTASLYLVNQFSTPEHRGYITGIQTIFGIIGISLQTVLGAVLFDLNRAGPFNYFAFICLAGILLTIIVYLKKGKDESENRKLVEEINSESNVQA